MGFSGHYSKYTSGLYPGDDYVDWIAYDPYNWFEKSGTWVSFKDTVKPFYDWLKANGHGDKPFMLGEFGAPDDPAYPTRQADWYQSIPSDLATSFPNLNSPVYFNSTTWTYDDTPASLMRVQDDLRELLRERSCPNRAQRRHSACSPRGLAARTPP